jgi:N-acetylmuramoyl-L-alanine amidase
MKRARRGFRAVYELLKNSEIVPNLPQNHNFLFNTVRNIGIKLLLLAITLLNFSGVEYPEIKKSAPAGSKVSVVVIDPGHGGKDPGTSGKKIKEKEVSLKIALLLGNYIEKNLPNVKVIYTRKDDRYLDLNQRAEIANKSKADVFVCIHANSAPRAEVHGTETYVMGLHKTEQNFEVSKRENSVMMLDDKYEENYEGFDPTSPESYILFSLTQSAFQESSLKLAEKVENQFKVKAGRRSNGVKQAGFWVLWKTTMPSILTEVGFLTNANEEAYLGSAAGQEAIAASLFRAFKDYKTQIEAIN